VQLASLQPSGVGLTGATYTGVYRCTSPARPTATLDGRGVGLQVIVLHLDPYCTRTRLIDSFKLIPVDGRLPLERVAARIM
jgi:hypothetical protein